MNVKEFREKYSVCLNYTADFRLCDKYSDKEVEAFAVCMNSSAFVFKGARAYFAYIDGCRMPMDRVLECIESAKLEFVQPPEKLKRYILLNSL